MANYNADAQVTSNKALTVIFIILIVLTNAGLIFKIVRRNSVGLQSTIMHAAKKLTIISLAIGDIFLALFYLVTRARSLFQDIYYQSCSTQWSVFVYGNFLMHFVYGTGLVVLAVELIYRLTRPTSTSHFTTTSNQSKIIAFIVSAIPWVLGFIIILPLTMAGMDWDTCVFAELTLSRTKAWYAVSLCLPASLALLAGFFAMCSTQSSNPSSAAMGLSQISPHHPTTNSSYDSSTQHMQTQPISVLGHQPYQHPQPSYQYPSAPLPAPYPAPYPAPHPAPHPASYPAPYPAPYPAYVHNQPPNYPQHDVYPQPLHNLPTDFTNFVKEKGTLLLLCITYFICVIPFAGFYLGYRSNEDRKSFDALTFIILDNLFFLAADLQVCTDSPNLDLSLR